MSKIPGQVVRLVILFAIFITVMIIVRQQFVPESFGELGHYRADAIDVVAALPVHYAGLQACAECHEDEAETKNLSAHHGLTCEGCHGAAADHAADPGEATPVIPTGRATCLRCHSYLPSRPTGFPQVIESLHNPMEPCAGCHDPHDPQPPETPSSCSACHASIERTKAVSHHWSLECTTCHEAAPQHFENPRAYLPKKPVVREFCGKCHARDAKSSSNIPRIDLESHGGRYLCWQCHYPHYPEGR